MQSSRVPIEVCEAIMGVFSSDRVTLDWPYSHTRQLLWWFVEGQRALCACALTCRAWRFHAQHLLWDTLVLRGNRRLALCMSELPARPPRTTALVLVGEPERGSMIDLSRASALFLGPYWNLQLLCFDQVDFETGPTSRVFRMRPPCLTGVSELRFRRCTFSSVRSLLDVVWAFPNLASLYLQDWFLRNRQLEKGRTHFVTVCHQLRACRKLTRLSLGFEPQNWGVLTRPVPCWHAGVFGTSVTRTELYVSVRGWSDLERFLRHSFPALRSLVVVHRSQYMVNSEYWKSKLSDGLEPEARLGPLLHFVAQMQLEWWEALKEIVLEGDHDRIGNNQCVHCLDIVGSGRYMHSDVLERLLPGLEALTIRFREGSGYREECVEYVCSVLPGLRSILRFEYRESLDGDWKEIALPITPCQSSSLS